MLVAAIEAVEDAAGVGTTIVADHGETMIIIGSVHAHPSMIVIIDQVDVQGARTKTEKTETRTVTTEESVTAREVQRKQPIQKLQKRSLLRTSVTEEPFSYSNSLPA